MVNDRPNFWMTTSANSNNPNSGICKNSEVWSSSISFKNGQSRGICNTEFNEWYDIPDDYLFSQEFWGELYYKSYGEMTAEEARAQCESDGAALPVPGSLFENSFYANLYPEGQIWLGLTTVYDTDYAAETCQLYDNSCTPVITSNLEGLAASFTNWGDEFEYAENNSTAGAYAYIDTRNLSQGQFLDLNRWNNNKTDSDLANAVCVLKIPRQYFSIKYLRIW